ncbi:hypothetical protein BC826DRAFT_600514 [Russula brevipes]|nr:hypothetical protein BC826DRAFT_600514 [Russula brevipes]
MCCYCTSRSVPLRRPLSGTTMIWLYSVLRTTSSAPTRPSALVHGNSCAGSYRNDLACDRCACGLRDWRDAVVRDLRRRCRLFIQHVPCPAIPGASRFHFPFSLSCQPL